MKSSSTLAEFSPDSLRRQVLNLDVAFHWLTQPERLWFKRETRAGEEFVLVNAATGKQDIVSHQPNPQSGSPRPDWVVSPDGRQAILRRNDNLSLRNLLSGEERRLTRDGEANFTYGLEDRAADLQKVARRRNGAAAPLKGVLWSPDGQFSIAVRQDMRELSDKLLLAEYAAPDQVYTPTHFGRFTTAGDAKSPDTHFVIIDLRTATVRPVNLSPQAWSYSSLHYFTAGVVWWSANGRELFLLTANRGDSRCGLSCVDLASGRTQEILHETARVNVRLNPYDYFRPNVHVTASGREILWYSERSGYGHLYLYDAPTGKLKRQITQGEWVVFDLLRVDEAERRAYFTAATRDSRGNPYYRYLYGVSLDGGEPQLLTPEVADHKFSNFFGEYLGFAGGEGGAQPGSSLSPSGRYFVDSYSTVEEPPTYVLRRISGELIAPLLSSDASALYASGWRPPERVVAKAADGISDLYGVITRPRNFDPAKKYPVIDVMYPGPQGSFAPRTLKDQLAGSLDHLQTFADADFIVVALDGRGTAHRSRAFREAFFGTEDVFGAADHVAAIKDLARERPYMDLSRVGLRGRSFGGYGSLRAILLHPDFFKVAVSATGPADYLDCQSAAGPERYFGVPSDSSEVRSYYDVISNNRLASRLQGRVLLVYGGIDENVPLMQAFKLFDAFIKADKDVDMLIVPDSAHGVPKEPYVVRRSVQYFREHLHGEVA